MMYFAAILKAVFLVAVPITISVYAALVVSALAERDWNRHPLRPQTTPPEPDVPAPTETPPHG